VRALAALLSLAKNAVPALGVLLRDWAAPGALLLYLGENIVLALLAALTVRLAGPPGHGNSLRTFFLIAAPFTFGAAILTAAVLVIQADAYTLAPRELLGGLALMVTFQLIGFAANLRRVRGITLAECENLLVGVLGRVFLLALAVWAGLLLAFFVTTAFVIPFMILKTIVDLGSLRPDAMKRRLLQGV
jgi:hypothetical protein